ncbi:Fibroblast growth factorreceptor 3 [Porites harrisoni]
MLLVFICGHALLVPISSLPVQSLSAKVGDTIELDCSVASQSNTEISWFKYGAPLRDITYRRTDGQSKSGKLLLDDLLLADSGNYTCSVNNTLGKINKTFALCVYESSSSHPIIKKSSMSNKTAVFGSEVIFHCHVASDSVTYVRWYFKGKTVETNTSSNSTSRKEFVRITNVLPVKVLSIVNSDNNGHRYRGEAMFVVQNISFKDEGEYICEAFNERGKTKCGAFLEVIKGPSPSALELENKYPALFEPSQDIPFAFLVAIPITLLVVLLALFIRALETAKRRCGAELVDKTDRNGDVDVFRNTSFNSKKESANQVIEKSIVISSPRLESHKLHGNSNHAKGGQVTPLLENIICQAAPSSWDRCPFCDTKDFSGKRCSLVEELEWEGIDLVMGHGFEKVKLSREEEV